MGYKGLDKSLSFTNIVHIIVTVLIEGNILIFNILPISIPKNHSIGLIRIKVASNKELIHLTSLWSFR